MGVDDQIWNKIKHYRQKLTQAAEKKKHKDLYDTVFVSI